MSGGPDIIIIGSGMGGATLACSLAPTGKKILILERGEALEDDRFARDDLAIFRDGHYRPDEEWQDGAGNAFNPGNYYNVGGNSKFFGAVFLRYREEDFGALKHMGGVSPAWPVSYEEMEPWYQKAEDLYQVRGDANEDPTEPMHSGQYPFPPVPDEPAIFAVRHRLQRMGLHPSSLPLGVDEQAWLARGKTPWDAFPDTTGAKKDAQSIAIERALKYDNVELMTDTRVSRLVTGEGGRIISIECISNGQAVSLRADLFVLSAGAVNSAALLLQSADERHPNGVANGSDMVGRNFMNHNCSALLTINPLRRNDSVYQKTLQLNDYYLSRGADDAPLGNIQLLGKISGNMLSSQVSLPRGITRWIARHSVDWYAMSEDLPNPQSRVTVVNGRICLDWKRSNWDCHLALVRKAKSLFRKAGYPIILSRPFDRRTPSHQCGTARFGNNPQDTVLDLYCKAHDHDNLYVVDASFLPSSAAVNPALTIAAQALRVGDYIKQREFAA